MQDAYSIPHFLWDQAHTALVGILAAATTYLFTRKKNSAETRRTNAETNHIVLSDQLAEGQMLVDLMKAGAQAVLDVERLRRQEEFQHVRADRLENEKGVVEAELALLRLELDHYIKIGKGNGG